MASTAQMMHAGLTARTGPVYVTDAEFRHLHESERGADFAHMEIYATTLSPSQLLSTVAEIWAGSAPLKGWRRALFTRCGRT